MLIFSGLKNLLGQIWIGRASCSVEQASNQYPKKAKISNFPEEVLLGTGRVPPLPLPPLSLRQAFPLFYLNVHKHPSLQSGEEGFLSSPRPHSKVLAPLQSQTPCPIVYHFDRKDVPFGMSISEEYHSQCPQDSGPYSWINRCVINSKPNPPD